MFGIASSRIGRRAPDYMRPPRELQSAFAQVAASASVTFGTQPRAGSLLLFLVGGWTNAFTVPAGLTEIGTAQDTNNQQVRAYIRRAQQGDSRTWTWTASSNVGAWGAEIADAVYVTQRSLSSVNSGSTPAPNPLSPTQILNLPALGYALVEMDNFPATIAAAADYTMLALGSASNHPVYLFRKAKPFLPNDYTGFGNIYSITGGPAAGTAAEYVVVHGIARPAQPTVL